MTRSNKGEVNLKSTAYNQNGQNYFEQLTAYNSMSAHIRRILLAKCVIDAKNKNYIRKLKPVGKQGGCKTTFVETDTPNNIIDKLAYDTLYHPAEFVRMYYNSKYLCPYDARKDCGNCYNYDIICARSKLHNHVVYPNSLMLKSNDPEPCISNSKNDNQRSFTAEKKTCMSADLTATLKMQHRCEGSSMCYESASELQSQEMNNSTSTLTPPGTYDNYESTKVCTTVINNSEAHERRSEDAKYAKFVYEITHEIIRNGLYTDEELQLVFKKHIEENKILDMNRMLYEIDQLKHALNMSENLEMIELDDRSKSIALTDANPELLVSGRDVMISLIEADINPEQARKIYKRLSDKSKDMFTSIVIKEKLLNDEALMKESSQSNNNVKVLEDVNHEGKGKEDSTILDHTT